MECFDISNLQGTEVVASMVVFEDGLPRKSEYRRFIIRGVDGQNDVAAMHEVITRRFRRLLDDRSPTDRDPSSGPAADRPGHGCTAQVRVRPFSGGGRRRPAQVAAAAKAMDELEILDVALAVWPSGWRRSGCRTPTSR